MGITQKELDEIKRLGLTHLATLLESVAGKEIETLSESTEEKKTVDLKGHFDSMFEGQELDAEFVTKAKAIFEAAVVEQAEHKLSEKFAAINEAVETQLSEAQAKQDERLDEYLNFVVKDWLQENEVAIESNAKVQKATALIEGITKLLSENDITIAESNEDDKLIKALQERAQMEEEFAKAIHKLAEAEQEIKRLQVEQEIHVAMSDMSEEQADAFYTVVSALTVESVEEFSKKIQTVKSAMIGEGVVKEQFVQEEVQDDLQEQVQELISIAIEDLSEEEAEILIQKAYEFQFESLEDFEYQLATCMISEEQLEEKIADAELAEKIQEALQEATKDMADTEVERFIALAEAISVSTFEEFEAQLKTISESFGSKEGKAISESVEQPEQESPMKKYIAAARSMSPRKAKK